MYPRNLADPVGLVLRMLRSGERAAYSALGLAALQIAAQPLDRLLLAKERRTLLKGGPLNHPIVLIVGLPRSGTTLAYQVLASAFRCTFFDNFGALFPRSTITATRALGRNSRRKPNSFDSYYGKTAGLSGPNDAFHVWNRWLGDDHYLPKFPLDPELAENMRHFFGAWMSAFPGPIVNKNNRNSLCMTELAAILPSAFFVVVERDPVYVAHSLYSARIRIHGDPSIGWGLGAQHGPNQRLDDGVKSVCDQVMQMAERTRLEIASVPPDRLVRVRYEDFCAGPKKEADRVASAVQNFSGIAMEPDQVVYSSVPDTFPSGNRRELNDQIFLSIERTLSQIDDE